MWLFTLACGAVMLLLAVRRAVVWSFGADTGTFFQVALHALSGFGDGPEGASHLHVHWSPIIGLLYPIAVVTQSPLSLQIVQIALILACGPLLYFIALPYVGEKTALLCAAIALIYPPLLSVAFEEFHELAFFPAIVLALFLCVERGRLDLVVVFALLGAFVREDVCLIFAMFGVLLIVIGLIGRKRAGEGLLRFAPRYPGITAMSGVLLVVTALGSLGAYAFLVLPRFGPWSPSAFYDYTLSDGSFVHGPFGLLQAAVHRPVEVARALLNVGRFTYLLEAWVPLIFLPLRSFWALMALPGFGIILLSNSAMVWRMGFHYAVLWIPWFLLASVDKATSTNARYALGVCALVLLVFNPMHPFHYLRPGYAHVDDARKALACVPRDASLSTHDEWFSAIVGSVHDATIAKADGTDFLVYADDFPSEPYQHDIRPRVAAAVRAGAYRVRCRFGAVTAYQREGYAP